NVEAVPPLEERALASTPRAPDSLAWPAEELSKGQVPVPELDRTKLLQEIKTFESRSRFGEGMMSDGSERRYRAGRLIVRTFASKAYLIPVAPERLATEGLPGDFAVEATGVGERWGLVVANGPGTATPTSRASVLFSTRTVSGMVLANSAGASGSMTRP